MDNGGARVYKPNAGNPFIPKPSPGCWTTNELLLKDQQLRKQSGVYILDQELTQVYLSHPNSGKY
jgi:hypothetical protein